MGLSIALTRSVRYRSRPPLSRREKSTCLTFWGWLHLWSAPRRPVAPVVGRQTVQYSPSLRRALRPFLRTTVAVHGTEVDVWNVHSEAVSFSDDNRQLHGFFKDAAFPAVLSW